MVRPEPFEIELEHRAVQGSLHAAPGDEDVRGAILICGALRDPTEDASQGIVSALVEALTMMGLSVACYRPSTAIEGAHDGVPLVDDASAVFRWLLLRADTDRARVGVAGFDHGAMIAAALARRTSDIARLCLISPCTPERVRPRVNGVEETNGEVVTNEFGELDPLHDVTVHERPTLIIHGAADREVDPDVGATYVRALELAGRSVRSLLVGRADHEISDPARRAAALSLITGFFDPLTKPGKRAS